METRQAKGGWLTLWPAASGFRITGLSRIFPDKEALRPSPSPPSPGSEAVPKAPLPAAQGKFRFEAAWYIPGFSLPFSLLFLPLFWIKFPGPLFQKKGLSIGFSRPQSVGIRQLFGIPVMNPRTRGRRQPPAGSRPSKGLSGQTARRSLSGSPPAAGLLSCYLLLRRSAAALSSLLPLRSVRIQPGELFISQEIQRYFL